MEDLENHVEKSNETMGALSSTDLEAIILKRLKEMREEYGGLNGGAFSGAESIDHLIASEVSKAISETV